MRRLILFDVDGTLLSTNGQAGRAIGLALRETLGTAGPIDGYAFAGKTDPQIVFELTALAGLTRSEVEPRLEEIFDRYCSRLSSMLTPDNTRALPGVLEILAELARRAEVAVGLLTGNIRSGAEIKLRAAGIGDRFATGAFGSDHEDRNRLVPIARARARDLWGTDFEGPSTVVIGDAEADIRCARAGGARAVAVASSKTSREKLAALAPDALLDSLDSPEALEALLGTG
ncbi:MAG: haloacid dehalogenase-like hydrolase [Acidobacteriia bacterium]|nr:haloacid dehalogenase-like hydrolase [Terriglobia bacterium]